MIGGSFHLFWRVGQPHSKDSITCEREDVAGVAGDDAGDTSEVRIQNPREFFGASLSARGESLGELGESGDIHQKDRPGTVLFKWRICQSPSRSNQAMLDSRQKTAETCFSREWQVKRHGLVFARIRLC